MHYAVLGLALVAYWLADFGNTYANHTILVLGFILYAVVKTIVEMGAIIDKQTVEIDRLKQRANAIESAPRRSLLSAE